MTMRKAQIKFGGELTNNHNVDWNAFILMGNIQTLNARVQVDQNTSKLTPPHAR